MKKKVALLEFELEQAKTDQNDLKIAILEDELKEAKNGTGKSLSEAHLFAEHGENMLCTKIVLNVRNNFCTQHVLPRLEL